MSLLTLPKKFPAVAILYFGKQAPQDMIPKATQGRTSKAGSAGQVPRSYTHYAPHLLLLSLFFRKSLVRDCRGARLRVSENEHGLVSVPTALQDNSPTTTDRRLRPFLVKPVPWHQTTTRKTPPTTMTIRKKSSTTTMMMMKTPTTMKALKFDGSFEIEEGFEIEESFDLDDGLRH